MNRSFLKVALFCAAVILIFVYLGIAITNISGVSEGPVILTDGATPEAGEAIFWSKGKCHTCHSIGARGSAVRGPNLGANDKFPLPIWVRAAERKTAEGYNALEYVMESIYDPNAYVVEGFSKGVMKPINRPPVALTDDEIQAVVVYLFSQGEEVADEVISAIVKAQRPFRSGEIVVEEAGAGFKFPPGDAEEGRYVFEDMKCFQCHKIEGVEFAVSEEDEGGVGPDLTNIGDIQTETYLAESILDPSAILVQGEGYLGDDGKSKMPEYHDTMTLRMLMDLVAYLSNLKAEEGSKAQRE